MTLLQQLAYQYDTNKMTSTSGEALMDMSSYHSNPRQDQHLRQQQQQTSRPEREDTFSVMSPERDHAVQQRENKLQLQAHEREQHLHQLQSINNLLLDLPSSPSPNSFNSSKFPHDVSSPTNKSIMDVTDMSISDLFGLALPRGSLMAGNSKEQGGQTNIDTPVYRNYNQQRDNSNGYYNSCTYSPEQQDTSSGYYSNSNNTEVPSSPISIHTPASPSTPGSLYSNSYSTYSSLNSSPYNSGSSPSSNYNKQLSSPVRSPFYGRPIRGSTPYSDCSSPSAEFPPHVFGFNVSRSNSPADSENSTNSIAGPLPDMMKNYLSQTVTNLLESEKYLQNGRATAELQKIKKYLHNSNQYQQQPQTPHYYHHHQHGHPRSNHYNQQQYNNQYVNMGFGSEKNCCVIGPRNPIQSIHAPVDTLTLDKAARHHRYAAAESEANYTWSGTLPPRSTKPIGYSSKVFFGGVPWDITESMLISTFKQFGQIKIEWPGKNHATSQPKGYCYIIFESEKHVQVIPWALNESNYVKSTSQKLDPGKTVFVGALHGMLTALGLATIMNDLFDNVIYAGIDTDKYKYPIGSARVTFSSKHSFNKAVNAAFIEVKTPKFTKKVQVDPYIEDAPCSRCHVQQGPYFCREVTCFKYYCHTCWQWVHEMDSFSWHMPMSRGLKSSQVIGLTPKPRGSFPNRFSIAMSAL